MEYHTHLVCHWCTRGGNTVFYSIVSDGGVFVNFLTAILELNSFFLYTKEVVKIFWRNLLQREEECGILSKLLQVSGKNPGVAKFGIAPEWGSGGRWFK
ncbi:MAG TPA: hypothetical protein H9841_08475, partial [Candidatus Flavonifractor merdigallinarum]|nr:hypothetical protein [Candidatus Flavonifractor merdigallinarum]